MLQKIPSSLVGVKNTFHDSSWLIIYISWHAMVLKAIYTLYNGLRVASRDASQVTL